MTIGIGVQISKMKIACKIIVSIPKYLAKPSQTPPIDPFLLLYNLFSIYYNNK